MDRQRGLHYGDTVHMRGYTNGVREVRVQRDVSGVGTRFTWSANDGSQRDFWIARRPETLTSQDVIDRVVSIERDMEFSTVHIANVGNITMHEYTGNIPNNEYLQRWQGDNMMYDADRMSIYIDNMYMVQILNDRECMVTPRITGETSYRTSCQKAVVREVNELPVQSYEDMASIPVPPNTICHSTWRVLCNDKQKHGVKREYTITLEKMREIPYNEVDNHYPKPTVNPTDRTRPIWSFGQASMTDDSLFMDNHFQEEIMELEF